MSFTKRQLVEAAYGELALAAYTFDLSPDEIQAGLLRIEGMLRTWKNQGIDTGYIFPTSPAVSDPDEDSGMVDFYEEAVRTNGAIRIAPLFGKAVSNETRLAATLAYQSMLVGRPVPVMQLPRNLPVGAANRWVGGRSYFTPCLPAGVSDPSVSAICSCGGASCCSKCIDEVTKLLLADSGAGMVGYSYFDQYPVDTVGNALVGITNQINIAEENQITPDRFYEEGDLDDTLSVRRAIRYCENNKKELHLPRIYTITDEIFIRKQIKITGVGAGAGYGEAALTAYRQISGFLVKGTGTRRIRTRQLWRGSAADPQDAPLSVALNIQAENCVFRDFSVFLDFDRTDFNPRNFGADWDVGIFVGCRVHPLFINVHAPGYWRQADYWFDVTRHSELPQFPDPDGVPFEKGTVGNGGDGATMIKCYARGGKWGVRIAGALPKPGENLYTDPYYDELLGATITDRRGSFGFSDFTMLACSVYGTDHHSNRRRDDFDGNYLTSTAGGALWISGMNGNGRIQGMRIISCRFATFEPFRVRLGRCNRVLFIGSHIENRGGANRLTSTGGPIAFDSTDTYGQITMEANTSNVRVDGLGGAITASGFGAFIDPAATYHEIFSGTSGNESTTFHKWIAASFGSLKGALVLSSETSADVVRLAGGTATYGEYSPTGFTFGAGTTSARIITNVGDLDLRAAAGSTVRLRSGGTDVALFDGATARFAANGSVRSTLDNTATSGSASFRWLDTYTSNLRLGTGATIETAGVGTPEGVVTAAVGSRFWRTDGAAGSRLYWKATGAGNTGWTAIL